MCPYENREELSAKADILHISVLFLWGKLMKLINWYLAIQVRSGTGLLGIKVFQIAQKTFGLLLWYWVNLESILLDKKTFILSIGFCRFYVGLPVVLYLAFCLWEGCWEIYTPVPRFSCGQQAKHNRDRDRNTNGKQTPKENTKSHLLSGVSIQYLP